MRAILEFEVSDAESVAKSIGEEKIPKTTITTKKEKGKIIFTIESDDVAAFSAAINSFLRVMKVIYGIDKS